jgi:hypothetical protein
MLESFGIQFSLKECNVHATVRLINNFLGFLTADHVQIDNLPPYEVVNVYKYY